ncbi:hypothetical protein F5H01DRAFT_356623 [Linnemannia elongata]|nr:hypothetical protein F5H01DRAFT_356623 [Linnemannia elongata]
MAQKTVRKRVLLSCTVLLAVALFVSADAGSQDTFSLGVEKFQEGAETQNKFENGKKLYQEAVELLEASPIKAHQRVFVKQHSSLARSFLSDELQKQKGILPTALRLVTQGVVSFFKSSSVNDDGTTPTSTSTSTPTTENENEDAQESSGSTSSNNAGKATVRRHRDANIAKAMDLLEKAGYEYNNDDALWTLANMYFHGQYKTKRDLGQAFDMYAALADRSGNGTAQQMVGFMYSTGLGNVVERDEAKAMLYTTFSAWANDTAAELTLGYKYMHGIGTKKSCDDSLFYYKRAADKAHAMYLSGPPLGRNMPPIKGRLTDNDGGTYGAGASGPGEPEDSAFASNIKDFIEFHRYIADGDSPEARAAQFQLGILFYTGNAVKVTIPRDYVKAGGYLKKVAESFFTPKLNTNEAILEAKDQKKREGKGRDVEDAALAAALLGKMYWRGEGFKASESEALRWFNKAAILENPVALNGLGVMHLKGAAGFKVNRELAIALFSKAAELKYPDAKVNLGLIYLEDPKYYSQAYQHFQDAGQMQNFQAVYYLGKMYYEGLGMSKQCEIASRYFKYVAERGDWGDTLFSDSYDAYQAGDVEYAAIGYLQAAERGYEVGQSNFAWILDRELPTTHYLTMLTSPKRSPLMAMAETALVSLASPQRLLEMALVYWTRSANQGDVDARVKMGDYYYMGIGTEKDYKKATACYRVAAQSEISAMAMWNLGWMHENGIGVAKDFHLAKRWYDQSLATNKIAVLPVSLSLARLNARFIWSYLTGGETGADASSFFWSIGSGKASSSGRGSANKDASDGSDAAAGAGEGDQGATKNENSDGDGSGNGWDLNEIGKKSVKKWTNQKQAGPSEETDYDDGDGFQQRHHRQPGGAEGDEEELYMDDDELVESVVIIGLCMVVGYLMYVRQFRFGNQQQPQQQQQGNQNNDGNNNNNNNVNNQQQQHQQPPMGGLPGDPNAPGRFAYYAAGG